MEGGRIPLTTATPAPQRSAQQRRKTASHRPHSTTRSTAGQAGVRLRQPFAERRRGREAIVESVQCDCRSLSQRCLLTNYSRTWSRTVSAIVRFVLIVRVQHLFTLL